VKVSGSAMLEVVRSRGGWRVLVRTNLGVGAEVVTLGPAYATQAAANESLEGRMRKIVEVLDDLGLEHGEPYA
jgi:hypothetical protein